MREHTQTPRGLRAGMTLTGLGAEIVLTGLMAERMERLQSQDYQN